MYTIQHDDQSFEVRTKEDLTPVPTAALVATYNEIAGKSIKKFSDRATAESRTWDQIEMVAAAPEEVIMEPTTTGRRDTINKKAKIRMVSTVNPKREGSLAAAHFELYEDGITVEAVQRKGVPLADIRWNLSKGYIQLDEEA